MAKKPVKPVNARIADAQIDHAVDLRGYTQNVINRMLATLNRAEKALFEKLVVQMQKVNPDAFTMERLQGLVESVRRLQVDAFRAMHDDLRRELKAFTAFEVDFEEGLLIDRLDAFQVRVAKINAEEVYAAAQARPFQGNLLKGFLDDIEASRARLIRRTIADGFVQHRTTDEIVRSLRGTRAKGYSDGLLDRSRRDVQSVVRTALSHYSAFAQQKVYDQNKDIIKGYTWVATLDSRTSLECAARDGLEYDRSFKPVGHTLPWGAGPGLLHWNCRSRRSPIIKSWRDMGVDIDEFRPDTRASLDGQVPAKINFEEWLKGQSIERQNEVLGVGKANLFRQGKLTLREMLDAKGKELTLDELRARSVRMRSQMTSDDLEEHIRRSNEARIQRQLEAVENSEDKSLRNPIPGAESEEMWRRDKEIAFARDENGKVWRIGTDNIVDTVEFSNAETMWMINNPNSVLTHVHPDGSSLSSADLELASVTGVKEIRAIGLGPNNEHFLYRAWRAGDSWPDPEDLFETYNRHWEPLGNSILKFQEKNPDMPFTEIGRRFSEESHKINEATARDSGYGYSRTKIDLKDIHGSEDIPKLE